MNATELTKKDKRLAKMKAMRTLKAIDDGAIEYYGKNPSYRPATHRAAVSLAKAVSKAGIECEPPTARDWELMVTEDELGRRIRPVLTIYKATLGHRKSEAVFGAKSFDDVIVSKTEFLHYVGRVK